MAARKKPGDTWKGHVSPAVKTAYNKKTYQAITFRLKRDGADGFTKEQMEAAADASGMSINAWILDAIRDKI